jgi:hypothetical protein
VAEAVERQPGGGPHQEGFRIRDGAGVDARPAQPGLLDHVLGVGYAAKDAIRHAEQQLAVLAKRAH